MIPEEDSTASAVRRVTEGLDLLVVDISLSGSAFGEVVVLQDMYKDLKLSLAQMETLDWDLSLDGMGRVLSGIEELRLKYPRGSGEAMAPNMPRAVTETANLVESLQQATQAVLYGGSRWWP